MNPRQQEILNITSEECGEIVVAISKINRFGLDGIKPATGATNRSHLEEEVGDLLAMIELLTDHGIVNSERVDVARANKHEKLRRWSNIYVV